MVHRVLVAVDDSPRSTAVASAAAELAAPGGISVRLYRAISIPPDFPAAAAMPSGDPLPAYLKAEATRQLQQLAGSFGNAAWEIEVEEAHPPWRAILDAADRFAADLIMIGGHGHHAFERLLGTTAAKVVNLSSRDVLVVHRPAPARS